MKTMYHCTLRKNLEGILKDGLSPRKPDLIRNAIKGVYLSENPFDWMHTATDGTTKAGAMIEVNVEGLELVKDQNIKAGVCFAFRGYIRPERFVNICISTDEKPYQFEQMGEFLNKTPESLNDLLEPLGAAKELGKIVLVNALKKEKNLSDKSISVSKQRE